MRRPILPPQLLGAPDALLVLLDALVRATIGPSSRITLKQEDACKQEL
jgi:hypothetical protein